MKKLSRHDVYINILEDERTGVHKAEEFLNNIIAKFPPSATENDISLNGYRTRRLNYFHNIALVSSIIKNKIAKNIDK